MWLAAGLAIGAADEGGSLREGAGLALQPILAGVRLALASLATLQLGRAAKPLGNVGIVDEGAAALGVLAPIVGAVQESLQQKRLVAQVGGVVESIDKLDCVEADGATPCGAAGGKGLESGEEGLLGHGIEY